MADIISYAAAFIFGAVIGSFVNVCVYRMPRGISVVRPRSACPACGAALRPAEMIPLASYIFLRARCSSCRGRISPRYPLLEAVCGAMWAAFLWKFSFSFQFACYSALFSVYLAVFFIDLECMRIPNKLVISAMLPASAAAARFSFLLADPERFRSVYGSVNRFEPLLGLLPPAFFAAVYLITALTRKGGPAIGMGDIKLLIPTGLALGLRQSLFAAIMAVMLGGLAGAALILLGRKNRKDPIPFGPFIVAGAFAAAFMPLNILF